MLSCAVSLILFGLSVIKVDKSCVTSRLRYGLGLKFKYGFISKASIMAKNLLFRAWFSLCRCIPLLMKFTIKGTRAPIFEFVFTSFIREFLSEFEMESFKMTEVITWKYCSNAEFKFEASGKLTPLALSTSSITFPSRLIQEASQITCKN